MHNFGKIKLVVLIKIVFMLLCVFVGLRNFDQIEKNLIIKLLFNLI